MDKNTIAELETLRNQLEGVRNTIEQITSATQDEFDELSESQQETPAGEAMQGLIAELEEACTALEEAEAKLADAITDAKA
jgi:exonuclease VII small subunit